MPWWNEPCKPLSIDAKTLAQTRQNALTKPTGALGDLEGLAINLAAMQGEEKPTLERIFISVFAADHGIAAQGTSAYPQAVTTEMVKNFANAGAAISVLANDLDAAFEVINLGTLFEVLPHPQIIDYRIAAGTQDFSQAEAMTEEQLQEALLCGQRAAHRAHERDAQLFIGGEMGIGNTTSATALAGYQLQQEIDSLVGPGTGANAEQIQLKVALIKQGLALHQCGSAVEALQKLGGFEIAGLVGAYIGCAQLGIPILVDGFISSSAVMIAVAMNPGVADWLFFGHQSAEPGHQAILASLKAKPILSLNMRLGEGSGAAVAANILRSACALHNHMATFEQAGVTDKG